MISNDKIKFANSENNIDIVNEKRYYKVTA